MLPEGWEKHPLESVARVQTGLAKGKKNISNPVSVPYLRVANVQDGYFDLSEIKCIEVQKEQIRRYLLKENDVLLTEGGDFDKLGRGGLWKGQINPCLHQNHVFVVRTNIRKLIPEFFSYLSSSSYGKAYFLRCSKQSTNLASINSSQLKGFPVLLPPYMEQQAVISILNKWDEVIAGLNDLIIEKKKQKRALIQHLLTGKHRFPEFEGQQWQEVELGDVFKEVKTKVGDKAVMPHSITAGTGFVSHAEKWGKDISGSQYEHYTLLKKGQFAYNKGNSKKYACGCMYLLKHEDEIAVPNVFISFERRKKNICNEFYEQYFIADYCARELRQYITSGARSDGLLNLNKTDFFSVKLPLPPLEEQKKIAATLNAADKEITLLTQKLEAYQEQKKGLMQQLLTGKKRVKVGNQEAA